MPTMTAAQKGRRRRWTTTRSWRTCPNTDTPLGSGARLPTSRDQSSIPCSGMGLCPTTVRPRWGGVGLRPSGHGRDCAALDSAGWAAPVAVAKCGPGTGGVDYRCGRSRRLSGRRRTGGPSAIEATLWVIFAGAVCSVAATDKDMVVLRSGGDGCAVIAGCWDGRVAPSTHARRKTAGGFRPGERVSQHPRELP